MRMNLMKLLSCVVVATLAGCSFNATLMSRDSGRTYSGELHSGLGGSGSMTVTIDGVVYTGPAIRVASNDTFGFASVYGFDSHGSNATSLATSFQDGDKFVKALLSSSDGKGLRCDIRGRDRTGGGICVDDTRKIYDVVVVRN